MEQQEHYQVFYYLKRKRGMTKEQFYDYWEHVNAKKVAQWAERCPTVISYRQVRSQIPMREFQKILLTSIHRFTHPAS